MGLERMRISGFKTYKHEEGIVFSDFTCIVGPNGVGKSNLVDAVLFALGAELSEIRGGIACRGAPEKNPSVEIEIRQKNGNIVHFKREIKAETSHYYIENEKVASKEYFKCVEEMNILPEHKNFLLSQSECMVRLPKEMTKIIDRLSGSSRLKTKYKEIKSEKEAVHRRYNEACERKKRVEVEKKESEEVQELLERHRELSEKRRVAIGAQILKKKQALIERKEEIQNKAAEIKNRHLEIAQSQELQIESAKIQTEAIKMRVKKSFLIAQRKSISEREAEEKKTKSKEIFQMRKKLDSLLEKESEALAQIEECAWQKKQVEKVAQEKNRWKSRVQKEQIMKAVEKIQKIERNKDAAQKKIRALELEREIKEEKEKEKEAQTARAENAEEESTRLSTLNKELLDILRAISFHTAYTKSHAYASKLGYYISQLKMHLPQILGRIESLITPVNKTYSAALYALVHSKRNIVLTDGEKDILPILHGLSRAGSGRVTVLPTTRIRESSATPPANLSSDYLVFSEIVQLSNELTEDQKQKLASYLCGDALLYLGAGTPEVKGYKVVTLDGIVISKEGVVRRVSAPEHEEIQKLEEKKERLLKKIREESLLLKEARQKENVVVPKSSPELEKMTQEHARLKQELEELRKEAKEETNRIISNAQVDPEAIYQALEQGVYDVASAEKKLRAIAAKEEMWRKTLECIQQELAKVNKDQTSEKTETAKKNIQVERDRIDQSIERVTFLEKEAEKRLMQISQQLESPIMIEINVLNEQLFSLNDEIEETEQHIAEEGIVENAFTASSIAQSAENVERLEKDMISLQEALKGKKAVPGVQKTYTVAVTEVETEKSLFQETQKAFNDVKRERSSLFISVFDKLNVSFNAHYSRLTNSSGTHSKAHLGIENSSEPYLGGTNLYVMPTGKTFREAKYLSGGEKAMASLALLLSIHDLYPAPFYIFDEMDAALDKDRLSSLRSSLREINTQFIAVTHRIELFETAETLLGIAKPPQGYSQVFTLRL